MAVQNLKSPENTPRNTKKQPTENQKNTKYRNISSVGAWFLYLALPPVSYATVEFNTNIMLLGENLTSITKRKQIM